jgi:hypothetical protein
MHCLWSVVAVVVVGCITPASAQVQNVNHTASGQPDTDIRVGVYVNVRPDAAPALYVWLAVEQERYWPA